MVNYANQLVRKVLRKSGYVPNVANLLVEPGAIVRQRLGRFVLVGRIDERARSEGDESTAKRLTAILKNLGTDENKHKFGLRYKSEGTTMISFDGAGETVAVAGQNVKVNVLLQFQQRSDYLFDTTAPVTWQSFKATEVDDILEASARYLKRREMIVTGVAQAASWLWYISKTRNAQLGFSGQAGGAGADIGKLADISASLQLKVNHGDLVDGRGENSVALFQALVRREFRPSVVGSFPLDTFRLVQGSNAVHPPREVLAALVPEDMDNDDDDDDGVAA
jgi:hypothetical protein